MMCAARWVHTRKGPLAAALLISLAGASCTSNDDSSASPTTSPPAAAGSSAPASEWLSLDDGLHHGIIEEVVLADGSLTVVVELIEVFGDQAAVDAAIEDGEASSGDDLANPFYLRHLDVTGFLAVSDGAQLEVLDPLPGPLRSATTEEFAALYNGALTPGPDQSLVPQPVEILIADGIATRLSQIYTP
jgi:hypothetical protein